MLTYLAEITAYDPSISGIRKLYYSSHGYTSKAGDTTPWGESRAHTHYEARLKQPGLMRRDVFSQGATGGASTTGYGIIELVNLGDLDALADYGFSGRSFYILLGDTGAALSTFTVALKGTMEQPAFDWGTLSIRIRDRLAELDKPCQTTLYLGNNSNPNGLEGYPEDIKGKAKPRVYGQVYNVSPPQVNNVRLIYQVNDGAVASIDSVYDQGYALTAGIAYTSQSDMEINTPASGQYRAWPAGGYFRLGASPVGPVTADVTQGASAATRTAAQILKSLAAGPGGIASGDIVSADVTALDAANSAVVGIWLPDAENVKQAMDDIANSVGAWWGFDRTGQLRMAQLSAPSGTPAITLDQQDIVSIERTATADTDKGVPAYQVKLGYGKNWTVQTSGLAGAVTDARLSWLQETERNVTATDTSVQVIHLLAPVLEFSTLLIDATAAQAEAVRRLTLYKTRRDRLNIHVRVSPALMSAIDLGSVLKIQIARYGYASGKLFRVIGLQPDLRTGSLDMTLWG